MFWNLPSWVVPVGRSMGLSIEFAHGRQRAPCLAGAERSRQRARTRCYRAVCVPRATSATPRLLRLPERRTTRAPRPRTHASVESAVHSTASLPVAS